MTIPNLDNLDDFAECDAENPPQWDVLIEQLKNALKHLDREIGQLKDRIDDLEALN